MPTYSSLGQGIAPNADGTGWNGTVSLTLLPKSLPSPAAPGGSVRVDSLVFSTGGYGSTMTVSVAYSTDGFATAGTFIAGSQATPVALNKVSSTGYTVLRLPLTGPAGVMLAAGGTVAFRLYYALGSGSARHALTKNLYVTGVATPSCPAATAVGVSSVTPSSAQLNFTPAAGNTGYTVTITPQGGSTTTLTPGPHGLAGSSQQPQCQHHLHRDAANHLRRHARLRAKRQLHDAGRQLDRAATVAPHGRQRRQCRRALLRRHG